jgi:ParB family transcriptional regulator, chromosome partitioning protein
MSAAKQTGLGRGLGALIKDSAPVAAPAAAAPGAGPLKAPLSSIRRSPWQPRHRFEAESLAELVQSVKERGVLQALLVRRAGDGYELIAGERRLRAATEAGLTEVPVTVMDVTDREALELALVENLQRADLNLIEEAEGYRALGEKFGLTQDEVAQRVGKARPTVANALRLLELPDPVKQLVAENRLSAGHAKVLLGLENDREKELLAERALKEGLSVRTLERIVQRLRRAPRRARAEKADIPAEHVKYLLEQMHQKLGTGVRLTPSRTLANGRKARGCLEIDFFSSDELDRILVILGLEGSL